MYFKKVLIYILKILHVFQKNFVKNNGKTEVKINGKFLYLFFKQKEKILNKKKQRNKEKENTNKK